MLLLALACHSPEKAPPSDTDVEAADTADTDTDTFDTDTTDTDTDPPVTVLGMAPADGDAWIALDTLVTVTFAGPVAADAVSARLSAGDDLPFTLAVEGPTVTLTPDALLAADTRHTVTIALSGGETFTASFTTVPTLVPVVGAGPWDPRLDLDGDGATDAVWSTSTGVDGHVRLALADLAPDGTRTARWSTTLAAGTLGLAPTWHWRSFMGDPTRDFTLVLRDGADLPLLAGDGATGLLRDWVYDLGDNNFGGVERVRAVATVDYELPGYPGPALLIDSSGSTRGRLYGFPDGSDQGVDLSADPTVIDPSAPWAATPFPGVDLPGDAYTDLYDAFNPDAPCEWIAEVWHYRCGVPDDGAATGYSLDKVAVADIDGDGVEDALSTFLWRSVVWPGRPHGELAFLGAPDYDEYYNPQDDGGYCHSGRRYGYAVTTQVDGDTPLETLEIAGAPVGTFADYNQEASYNVALIDADDSGGRLLRGVVWNHALGTMIPGCGQEEIYDGAMHVPGEGHVSDAGGVTTHLFMNRFYVDTIPGICPDGDYACYIDQLMEMSGAWSFVVLDALTGDTVFEDDDTYVWDTLTDPDTGDIWVLYSAQADRFNVGTESWDFVTDGVRSLTPDVVPQLRADLAVARLDLDAGDLVDVTLLGGDYAPYLLAQQLQSLGGASASNFSVKRLLTVPSPSGGPPAFAVHGEDGITLVARVADRWVPVADYSVAGDPAGTWAVLVDDAFDDGDIGANPDGIGGGFVDESYGVQDATEADGALLLHDPQYLYAGVRSVDRWDPIGVEVRIDIAAVDTDVVTTDGAPGDQATRTVVGLVDDAAGVFFGAGGQGIYVELATVLGAPRTGTVAIRGADYAVLLAPVAIPDWDGNAPITLVLRTDADGWHLRASEAFSDGTMGRSGTWYGTSAVLFPDVAEVGLVIAHQFESTVRVDAVRVSDLGG
jgi:hypothetical protein